MDFTSKVHGRRYRVQIAMPWAPPPECGYPVLYVLDGDAYFPSFADAARSRSALGSELEAAVVVGISYPDDGIDDSFDMSEALCRRYFDLTLSQPDDAALAIDRAFMGPVNGGGAAQFLKVIETEIQPRVASLLPVNPARGCLFGHSLGGLFTLYTLFTKPAAFDTYLALSPSIWWNHRALLDHEADFARRMNAGEASPKIFVGVGGAEQQPPTRPGGGFTLEQRAEFIELERMVDNAAELASRLAALRGGPGYKVEYCLLEGHSHMSAPWAGLNAMLDFALPPALAPVE
jgi:predicted alpha/beta superfamily hydrolase